MALATLTSKGQTTIPKAVRDHLRLKPGDRLRFGIDEHGRVALEAATVSIMDLRGILPKPPRAATIEDDERHRSPACGRTRESLVIGVDTNVLFRHLVPG